MSKKLAKRRESGQGEICGHKGMQSHWPVLFLKYLLDGMISVYMLLIIVVMPFYNEEGFSHIGTDKAVFFRTISGYAAKLILPALGIYLVSKLVLWLRDKRTHGQRIRQEGKQFQIKPTWSVTDCFALLYGAALILSYLCSSYKDQALWGAVGWYMGFLPHIILLSIYFLISRLWHPKAWIAALFLPASMAVFLLGYLNRFGIFPIDMKVETASFISTIGNINWYCGYLVSVFFGGYYLLWQSQPVQRAGKALREKSGGKQEWKRACGNAFLGLYVVLGFASLVTQGSRSGLAALAVVFLVVFCLSAKDGERMQRFWQGILLFSLACMATLGIRKGMQRQLTASDALTDLLTDTWLPLLIFAVSTLVLGFLAYCRHHGGYPVRLFAVLTKTVTIAAGAGAGVVALLILWNTLSPGILGGLSENPEFTYSLSWGSGRGATWKAGWMCFWEQDFLHKLAGVGPDCMSAYLYGNGSAQLRIMLKEIFGETTLTNSHNEWLTVLANTGITGIIGFAGMIISAMLRFLKASRQQTTMHLIVGACGLCILAYTVNNMFSFQQSMNTATIFVILGMGEACFRAGDKR